MRQPARIPVPAFDQDETIVGQGTVGLELEQRAADIDTVLVAVGGGGLIAGIAAWYAGRARSSASSRSHRPPSPAGPSKQAGPVDAEAGGLAANSLAPRRVGERVFRSGSVTRRKRCW